MPLIRSDFRWLRVALLVLATASLTGCAGGGFLADLFTGGKTLKKKYTLPDRDTAILVDDPQQALGGFQAPGVVARNVAYHLERNRKEALPTGRIVEAEEVEALRQKLGDDFAITPIDQVGRLLGVAQVIHVEVRDADVLVAANVYRPQATVAVRVIDAQESRRLWPEVGRLKDTSRTPPPYTLNVAMNYRGTDHGGEGLERVLSRALAEEIGKEVAELFYDHKPPPAGHTLK